MAKMDYERANREDRENNNMSNWWDESQRQYQSKLDNDKKSTSSIRVKGSSQNNNPVQTINDYIKSLNSSLCIEMGKSSGLIRYKAKKKVNEIDTVIINKITLFLSNSGYENINYDKNKHILIFYKKLSQSKNVTKNVSSKAQNKTNDKSLQIVKNYIKSSYPSFCIEADKSSGIIRYSEKVNKKGEGIDPNIVGTITTFLLKAGYNDIKYNKIRAEIFFEK